MKLFSVSLCLFLFANTVFASSQADLEAAARKEGALNLFTNGLEYGFVLERAFRARYPEIKIQHTVFQPAGPRYYDHSMMENEKSEFRADVVLRCQDRDLTEWVDSDWMADLSDLPNWSRRPKHIEDDSRYVYFLGAPHVLVYNPAKIKEGDLPKNYGELLDPKWKGKISLRSPLRGNSAAFFAHFIQANHVGITWFEKLSANHPFVGQSSYSVHDAVEKGDYPIGLSRDVEVISFQRDFKKLTGKNSKLKFKIMEGESPYQYQLSLMNKKAPHSAAARLFLNFVFSDEAVAALEKAGFSVGGRQEAQMKHARLWQWKLREIKRYFSYQATLAAAYRALKFNGAKIEPEKSDGFNMAEAY